MTCRCGRRCGCREACVCGPVCPDCEQEEAMSEAEERAREEARVMRGPRWWHYAMFVLCVAYIVALEWLGL